MSTSDYSKSTLVQPAAQRETLDAVLAAAKAAAPHGIIVFDLDSTLFDNRPRQARILREYGKDAGIAVLEKTEPRHFTSWSLKDAMRAAGTDDKTIVAHAAKLKSYWRDRFFTSAYSIFDQPIPGAADYLHAALATGARIAYVTGRHAAMGEGTIACMKTSSFPLPDGERVHLILKPTLEMNDDAWKAEARARLDRLGQVVAAFDNEPSHVNGYAAHDPSILAVHLATDDSGRPIQVAPGVPSIANFLRS